MKKIKYFLVFLSIFNLFSYFYVDAKSDLESSAIVMDVDSGRVLYSKNIHKKKLIASITKIMTCIIVIENSDIDKIITVGDEVLSMYGTNIYLEVGEKITIRDLLYGLMLRSGNDAAIVLAINTFGSEKEFVKAMNTKASEIGMRNTTFSNSHGLDDNTKNYSTAYDMALLSRYAYKNQLYREIINTRKYSTKSSLKSYLWYNRMSLLTSYKNCIGGKNGYTPSAGKTLISYAKKGDFVLTIVSLNDSKIYDNHKSLYKEYFNKYNKYKIIDKNNFYVDFNFYNGKIFLKEDFYYSLLEDELDDVSTLIKLSNSNITKDNVVGNVIIKLNNEEIGKINIYKKKIKKDKLNIFKKLLDLVI